MIESGLLYEVLSRHEDVVKDFRSYETITSQGAADPQGLLHCIDFLNDVLDLAPQCELHPQPLRNALLRQLTTNPALNQSQHNGSVWVRQRAERVSVLLSHVRRMARQGTNGRCTAQLTSNQLRKLTNTLQKVDLKENIVEGKAMPPLENGESSPPAKKLKKNDSDVSLDSKGWPMVLKTPPAAVTPEKVDKTQAQPPRLLQKRARKGELSMPPRTNQELQKAMGMTAANTPKKMKRPAASQKGCMKKPVASLPEADPRPWVKLHKTSARKPERAYLTGTKDPGGNSRLIVEVSKVRSSQYNLVVDKLKDALQKHHLSKPEALALRDELCKKHP